ncbi:hypothetical protein [Melittangium boletus]|uniref:Uncharacterized protein n=1 Tax=Melittangium boletus DSM 14713 TaxID=1294270 RepID=A0A250IGN9_9BACT|nr:hypothetical protein [Melittangium boletus]ATB30096.1 hypothetical protein MEBOL_003551 [Melittangium boletus DSM 14713]
MSPHADLVVRDRENRNVLIVEVKGKALTRSVRHLPDSLLSASKKVSFAMWVDPLEIRIFRGGFGDLSNPICILRTRDILQHYDPEFASKRIFSPYLTTLVDAWLRDLAYHWNSPVPPASAELDAIGLLQQLSGGSTEAEAQV